MELGSSLLLACLCRMGGADRKWRILQKKEQSRDYSVCRVCFLRIIIEFIRLYVVYFLRDCKGTPYEVL